jgi:hypothetical protein
VPDEDDAAAAVVLRDVVLPRVDDVGVRQVAVDRDGRAAQDADQPGERHLAVDGREQAADLAEPGGLLPHDEELLVGARDEIAVAGRIGRDGRVDVEAVDLRLARRAPALRLHTPVRAHDRRLEVDVADVVHVGPAEPVRRVRVGGALVAGVRIRRVAPLRLRGRCAGQEAERDQHRRRRTKLSHARRMT